MFTESGRSVLLPREYGRYICSARCSGGKNLGSSAPDHMSVPEQFQRIAEIADTEGWSFAFLADGGVRFGGYARAA